MRRQISYFLLPFSQLCCGAVALNWLWRLGFPPGYFVVAGAIILACVPVDFLVLREMKRAQHAQAARMGVQALEDQEKALQSYRESMERHREDVLHVRHAAAEELGRAQELLANGSDDSWEHASEAMALLDSIGGRLCDHPSVNAAAAMKLRDGRAAGVKMDCSLHLPACLAVRASELCAVIVNLADNAVTGARRAKAAGAREPHVSLRAFQRGEYLVVETRNSIAPTDEPKFRMMLDGRRKRSARPSGPEGHGWGLAIVEGIAKRYGGALTAHMENGIARTTVMLHVPECEGPDGAGEELS